MEIFAVKVKVPSSTKIISPVAAAMIAGWMVVAAVAQVE
jgi:hypothetical protein